MPFDTEFQPRPRGRGIYLTPSLIQKEKQMKAAWKQKKFERLAQKNVVEELKGQIKILQEQLRAQKERCAYVEERMDVMYKQREKAALSATRYELLRGQEVMIATPDGFKLLTGEELDAHCGGFISLYNGTYDANLAISMKLTGIALNRVINNGIYP